MRGLNILEGIKLNDICNNCPYNIDEYCIMFDDVLGFEDCVFNKESDE